MPWEETKDFIRSGHRNPEEFEPDSLRTITLSEEEGIQAVIGKPKGQKTTEVVSYLFRKEKGWTLEKAKEWFKRRQEKAKESFSWAGSIKEIPGVSNLIRGKALHPMRTVHPEEWPEVREYLEEELQKSAHTLAGTPLLLDHYQVLQGKVLGTEYEDGAIEYVAQLNDPGVMELVRNGAIKHCSVEFEWKSLEQVNGVAPRGINFTGLSLLRLFQPGDPLTTVEVWEGIIAKLKEAKNVHCSGHPAPVQPGIQPASGDTGVMKMGKEKPKLKTLEGRVTYLETSKRLKEQELSKEEIEAKINELTEQRQNLENELQQIAEEEQPRRDEIWQQIDLINAELQAYQQALAALVAGLTEPAGPPGSAEEGKAKEAEWDTEYINDLPDGAFAVIAAGGEKDDQGKTVPRALRKLPHHNAQGNLDLAHLRNALARVNQIEPANLQAQAKKHLCGHARSEKAEDLVSEFCGEEPETASEQQGEEPTLELPTPEMTEELCNQLGGTWDSETNTCELPLAETRLKLRKMKEQEEPEKDEHGCIIGKERWDPDQEKCVPIATEQQGEEEPEKDEHGCVIGKERYDEEQGKCVPIEGSTESKKKGLGEAIIEPRAPQQPTLFVPVEKLEAKLPPLQAERSMGWGAQRFVQDVKRLIREAKEGSKSG